MKACHNDVCLNVLYKDIVPICFYRFVDVVMVLTYLYSQNSQIELAGVRYLSIKSSLVS
eukprot:TRINITY_DN3244_c1_g5_i1.p1 TRINITY_DN3244_c1_g5~~TRINITY_DN3244_c1_g5_i1.p1  ORF type:complete len:59 (+),score=13.34 TRINITY_DN3244_c1_g5_i1:86-262(+)